MDADEYEMRTSAFKQMYPDIYHKMNLYIKDRDALKFINELELVKNCIPGYMLDIYKRIYSDVFNEPRQDRK